MATIMLSMHFVQNPQTWSDHTAPPRFQMFGYPAVHVPSANTKPVASYVQWQDGMGKYPLPAAPGYMDAVHREVAMMEPPVFATQGEAAGKHKGRKPKAKASPKTKSKAKGDGKPKARGSRKSKATPKAKGKASKAQAKSKANQSRSKVASKASRAKAKEMDTGASGKPDTEKKPRGRSAGVKVSTAASSKPDTEKKPRGRSAGVKVSTAASSKPDTEKKPRGPSAGVKVSTADSSKPDTVKRPRGRSAGVKVSTADSSKPDTEKKPGGRRSTSPAGDNEPRVPPAHITHNHIYSSAYRKALSMNPGNKEHARSQGHAAVDFFKLTGTVNSLCGQFRKTIRTKNGADASV